MSGRADYEERKQIKKDMRNLQIKLDKKVKYIMKIKEKYQV